MRGKFIGNDSMGFKHGTTYSLRSDIKKMAGIGVPCICLYDINSQAWCPYQNLETLLENWIFY